MQAFIAGPLTDEKLRKLDFYIEIAAVCKEIGLETFLPHLQTRAVDKPADEKLVFRLDIDGLKNSHLLIADVSDPSHGVGTELMQANFMKIPIVCLAIKGRELSRMVTGNPMVKEIIRYDSREDCLMKLKEYLPTMKLATKSRRHKGLK